MPDNRKWLPLEPSRHYRALTPLTGLLTLSEPGYTEEWGGKLAPWSLHLEAIFTLDHSYPWWRQDVKGTFVGDSAHCLRDHSHTAYVERTSTGFRGWCYGCEAEVKAARVPRGALSLCEPDMAGTLCLYEGSNGD